MVDNSSMDGLRKIFFEEFSSICAFNLRGGAHTQGEKREKESGNVFGSGSRTPMALAFMIKKPGHQGPADIFCRGIGDYLTKENKLLTIKESHDIFNPDISWQHIAPNMEGGWLNQRSDLFKSIISLESKSDKADGVFFYPICSL